MEPRPGRRLRPEESPKLWQTLAQLRTALRSGRCHRVLLTPEFNAGINRSRADRDAAVARHLVPLVRLPGRVVVIASQPGFAALARKVTRFPGAQVYPPGAMAGRVFDSSGAS